MANDKLTKGQKATAEIMAQTAEMHADTAPDSAALAARVAEGALQAPLVTGFDPSLIAPDMVADITVALKPGQQISGVFLGMGEEFSFPDTANNGKLTSVPTVTLAGPDPRVRVRLMASHQILTELAKEAPGLPVVIQHHGQTDTRSGRRVNRLVIFKGKRA